MSEFKIDPDYVEVAQRIRDLFAKHPNASLGGSYEIVEIGGQARVVYRATCHREPNDPNPGVGTAWEDVPGKTPYTKGSEIQNAETSAWGRAIVAVGASESKRIASADEMRSARAREEAPPDLPPPDPEWVQRVNATKDLVVELNLGQWVKDQGFTWPWSPEVCDTIDAKVGFVKAALAAPEDPPAPPASPATPPEATDPASPPCATDAAEEATQPPLAADPKAEPGDGDWIDPAVLVAQQVDAMPSSAVFAELEAAGLATTGAPKALKKRLTAHRIVSEGAQQSEVY